MKNIFIIFGLIISFVAVCQDDVAVEDLNAATTADANDILYFEEDGVAKNITKHLLQKDVRDSLIAVIFDIAAKIGLDEMHRLSAFDEQGEVTDSDTLAIKNDGAEKKATKGELFADTDVDIGILQTQIDVLEDSIAAQRLTIASYQATSLFDTLYVSAARDKVYVTVSDDYGQVRVTLNVDEAEDNSDPYVLSMVVEDADPDMIVITMNEYMDIADSSINRFSGASGANWPGMDAANNFDESIGDLLDLVGSDDGVLSDATPFTLQGDSAGVAGNAYAFSGNDVVTFGTGINYGTNDHAGSVHLKPGSLASDFRIYSGSTGGFFIGYNASSDGLWAGVVGGSPTTVTTITLTEDVWNHVCWSYDQVANQITFWIDGVSEVESYSGTFSAASDRIGSTGSGSYYTGLMDDLFLFDDYKFTQNRVDSLATRRYNESGGGQLVFQDSIKDAFTVSILPLGTSYEVDSVFIQNDQVKLDLNNDITYGDLVRVSYDESVNYGIRDTSDNKASSWALYSATNNVDTATSIFIVKEWDFDDWVAGAKNEDSIADYFGQANLEYENDTWFVSSEAIGPTTSNALKFLHKANEWWQGARSTVRTDTVMYEAYLTYYIMLDEDFDSGSNGKMSGLSTFKDWNPGRVGDEDAGWLASPQMKYAGYLDTYHYDDTYPWSWSHDLRYSTTSNTAFVSYGTVHKIDIRVMTNSSGGVADGLFELAIDNKLHIQMTGINSNDFTDTSNAITGVRISSYWGGSSIDCLPTSNAYSYMDSYKLYIPLNSPKLGKRELHDDMWDSPNSISGLEYYYDEEITSAAVAVSDASTANPHTNYAWRVYAGSGNKVTLTFSSGSLSGHNYLSIVDGKDVGDDILDRAVGSINLVDAFGGDGVIESTGEYMTINFSSDYNSGSTFSGVLTFTAQ